MSKKDRGGDARRRVEGRTRGPAPGVHCVYFDGACGPVNPGGIATFGWRLVGPDGQLLASDCGEVCRGPAATNNVAEWQALLRALRSLVGGGWRGRLRICGDSQLVVNQLIGRWKCHKEELRRCRDECLELLAGTDWEAIWVPRAGNAEADALSKQAAARPAS